jgi:D-alanyl-D-alanine carboxypeptidase
MKRIICLLLALILMLPILAAAEDEEELDIEETIDGESEEDAAETGEAVWDFPVALEDMNPDFVILANKHYLLEEGFYVKPLVKVRKLKLNKDGSVRTEGVRWAVGSQMKLQEDCYKALVAMSDAAREDGYNLYLKSAYRSWRTQNTMYKNRLKKNHGKDDGWVSKAGASDHQTGLGADVIPKSWIKAAGMNSKMAKEPECQWMAEHCSEYGFIIRYPEDKEEVTEINYEPWHVRYVGIPVATYIMENGLCLEEFNGQLQQAIEDYLATGGDRKKVEAFIQKPDEE